MRGILAIGLVSVSACSGGPGTTAFNGTDQTSPPSYTQSPINGTQQAALDPQAAPPLDPQSAPPSGGQGKVSSTQQICSDWCQLNIACLAAKDRSSSAGGATNSGSGASAESCITSCAAELAMPDLCTGAQLALVQCVLASRAYSCSLKEKDIPAACAQAFSNWQACDQLQNPDQPGPIQKGTGGAGQGNPGKGQTGGASQGPGGTGRTGGVGQGTGGVGQGTGGVPAF